MLDFATGRGKRPAISAIFSWVPVAAAVVLVATVAGAADRTPSPPGAKVFIVSPKNGAKVASPFKVEFGLSGMALAPAGVKVENTGHHHLLIDTPVPEDLSLPLPNTDQIRHFGKAQTEVELTLPPGKHTLQLILGDSNHIPHDPAVISKKITVTVTQ